MNDSLKSQWAEATGNLPFGVQRVFKDVLDLVAEGTKKDLVYGADYTSEGACLVNASANMLVVGGGHGIPMANFTDVVSLFDKINNWLYIQDVNTSPNLVSPLAAEILSRWYAPLKESAEPIATPEDENVVSLPYSERTDAEMEEAFMTLLESRPMATPFDNVEPINVANAETPC